MAPTGERDGAIALELVGPAGSGKSSVLWEVASRPDAPRVVDSLRRSWPETLATAFRTLPVLVRLAVRGPGTRPLRWAIRLRAPASLVHGEAVLFDQGPVYTLARLHDVVDGSTMLERWWSEQVARWAHLLTGVIVLDAPDDVLEERIRGRSKDHVAKTRSSDEICAFVDAERRSIDAVIDEVLAARAGFTVYRAHTDHASLAEVADAVLDLGRTLDRSAPDA